MKQQHSHQHTHVHGGDHFTTYVAPSRTTNNFIQQNSINLFEEITQQVTRKYVSQITLPSIIQNDYMQLITNPKWDAIINKPNLATTSFVNDAITNANFATEGFVGNAITNATSNLVTND